jgi:exosortase family protein XrtM
MSPTAPSGTFPSKIFGLRFVALFLGIFALFSLTWSGTRGSALERLVIDQTTVAAGAWIIDRISPEEGVRAEGPRLISPKVRLSVLNGCEGTESILLFAAAVLAFPAPWRKKPAGLLLGLVWVFLLNQARIVSLFFILRHRPQWFEAMHGTIAPIFIIIAGGIVFSFWLNWASREGNHARPC